MQAKANECLQSTNCSGFGPSGSWSLSFRSTTRPSCAPLVSMSRLSTGNTSMTSAPSVAQTVASCLIATKVRPSTCSGSLFLSWFTAQSLACSPAPAADPRRRMLARQRRGTKVHSRHRAETHWPQLPFLTE